VLEETKHCGDQKEAKPLLQGGERGIPRLLGPTLLAAPGPTRSEGKANFTAKTCEFLTRKGKLATLPREKSGHFPRKPSGPGQ